MTISPADLARFRADAADVDRSSAPLIVAVSGGPDSLALLLLAEAAWGGRVIAATVDHGLRTESAAEAAYVAQICAARGIVHAVLAPDAPITGSLQAEARRARYHLLETLRQSRGAAFILTAHHADDQAETLLMRLNRGAGVGGLAGIRAVNGAVVRPLLNWHRAELEAIVGQAGLVALRDPSNENPRFDRVRMRRHLAEAHWIDRAALARAARHLAEAEQAITWSVDQLEPAHLRREDGAVLITPDALPPEILRRLVLRAVTLLSPEAAPSGPELDRALAALAEGRQASLGALLVRGGALWRIWPAPARRAAN